MINRSVAGVVCPVAGVILTVVEENHPVAVVACPVARVMQNCVAQVTSKSTVIGSLVYCTFAKQIVYNLWHVCLQSMLLYENFSTTHASRCVHFQVQPST